VARVRTAALVVAVALSYPVTRRSALFGAASALAGASAPMSTAQHTKRDRAFIDDPFVR